MPRRLRSPLLFLATILLAWAAGPHRPASGQGTPGPADTTTVTFKEAVRTALDRNTDLKRAQATARLDETQVQAEWLDFSPDLSFNTGVSRRFGRSFSEIEGQIITQSTDFFNTGTSTRLTLFNGFENVASLRASRARAEASEQTLRRTRREVVFRVMERYVALLESGELIRVREEEVEARRRQLQQIREFVEAGARPVSDRYQEEARVAEARQQLLQARRERAVRKTELIQTLQLDPRRPYRFERPALPADTLNRREEDLSSLIGRAFEERLDLRAAEADQRAAERGVRAARSVYYPSLSVSAGYGTSWTSRARSLPGQAGTPSFADQLDNNRNGSLRLSLSIPIYDQGRRSTQVEQAQVQTQEARYALQDRRQEVALQVRQAYLDHRNAAQQLEAARKRLRAAEQARSTVRKEYNLGSTSIVELQNATRDYVEAASGRIRARYNLLLQRKRIDYYIGRLDPQEPLLGRSGSGR